LLWFDAHFIFTYHEWIMFQLFVFFICFVVYLSLHLNNYFDSNKWLLKLVK